ncbi:dystroglycan 1-like [Oppia nitens]|uniref:dystroglycan 1-like n=1 Tax=Oppia nitens TaxID=1686743 RepID=UPI0023DB9816|nr:dystroglycan 1-like [Oppia nitens]
MSSIASNSVNNNVCDFDYTRSHGSNSYRKCLPYSANRNAKHISYLNILLVLIITSILVTCIESLESVGDHPIPVGKVFRLKFRLDSDYRLKYLNVSLAGNATLVPDWIYLKRDTNELIAVPFEKGVYFIEVNVKYYGKQSYSDIFAFNVVDSSVSSTANQVIPENRCVIRLKQSFDGISDVWRIISSLMPHNLVTNQNSKTYDDWLLKFTISRNPNKEYLITYDIDSCDINSYDEEHDSNDKIHIKLKKLGYELDVVRISRRHLPDGQLYSELSDSSSLYNDNQVYDKINSHNRRYVNPTPILAPSWATLTTSTILSEGEDSTPDPVSRVLIPSMTSPTVSLSSASLLIPSIDPLENQILGKHDERHNKYKTRLIYTTPVLAPERPTIVDSDLLTPILVTPTPTFHTISVDSATIPIAPSPSVIAEVTVSQIEVTTEKEKPTTSPPEIPSTSATLPNKTPYINKRIRKLDITSGKYWKYTIPAETFVDFEDGDTRKLKLTFLTSTSDSTQEQPSSEFWIQFDHENQYLYALPTDEDIGKHLFKLVAVDSSGAHVSETLEVHVRQHMKTRAFTHIFTLSSVVWDPFQFAATIDATSSLLKRVATRVFDDNDIKSIAVQKIAKNERDNSWTISWTNDTLQSHPCPRETIQSLYTRLHDSHKKYDDSAEPSRLLRQTIGPEFSVQRVNLNFITKSACGSYEMPDNDEKKPKENPVFRNRIGKLGPFKLGQAFKYRIPEDTVFSSGRQVGTRDLILNIEAIEPAEIPEFIYFDSEEQELFGLAINHKWIGSYELKLVAEDNINGGSAYDIFSIDIVDEITDPSKQYTFEVLINLMAPQGRDTLNAKEKVDIVNRISSGMFSDGDSNAVHVLSIKTYQYDGLSPAISDDNYLGEEPEPDSPNKEHNHHSRHKHRERNTRDTNTLYYFEYKWTNSTIHEKDDKCPKDLISENVLKRIFQRDYDSLKAHKEVFEPNFDLINVEFQPLGVCTNFMNTKTLGARPVPITSPPSTMWTPTQQPTPREDEDLDNVIDIEDSNEFLLTTIIPPVAILIALIFAAIVGCCFHRANKRRKSIEISSRLPTDSALNEREAFLQKGRIPIIFEFEQQQHQQLPQQPQQYNMTPVIMPPSQQTSQHIPPQQMTPLRQLSSSTTGTKHTYQPLPQSGSQMRRQPPPYYK